MILLLQMNLALIRPFTDAARWPEVATFEPFLGKEVRGEQQRCQQSNAEKLIRINQEHIHSCYQMCVLVHLGH